MRYWKKGRKILALVLSLTLLLTLPGCAQQATDFSEMSYAQRLGMMNRSIDAAFSKVLAYVYWWGARDGRLWAYGPQTAAFAGGVQPEMWVASADWDGRNMQLTQLTADVAEECQQALQAAEEEYPNAACAAAQELAGLPFGEDGSLRPILHEMVSIPQGYDRRILYESYTLCTVGENGQLQRGPQLQFPKEYAGKGNIPLNGMWMESDDAVWLRVDEVDSPNGLEQISVYLRFSAADGSCEAALLLPDGCQAIDQCRMPDGSWLTLAKKRGREYVYFFLSALTGSQPQLSEPVSAGDVNKNVYGFVQPFSVQPSEEVELFGADGIYKSDPRAGTWEIVLRWNDYNVTDRIPKAVMALANDQFLLLPGYGALTLLTLTDTDMLLSGYKTVTFSLLDGTVFPNGIKAFVDAYNSTGPEVYIKTVDYSEATAKEKGYESGSDMLQDDLRKGTAPDILLLPSGFPTDWFVRYGQFADLAPYLDADDTLSRQELLPGILQACAVGDTLPTLPLAFRLMTLVGAADVVGDGMGWNWQQFDALCAAHPQADPYYPLGRDAALLYLVQLGGTRYVDYAAGQAHLDSPDFVQRLQSFAAYQGRPNGYNVDPKALFANGDALLEFYSLSDYRQLLTLQYIFDGPVGFKGFPTDDGRRSGAVALSGGQVAINQSCKDPAAAWAFLRTLFGEEAQETVSGFPVRRSALQAKAQVAQQVNISAEFFDVPIWLTVNENQLADWQRGLTQEETDQITALVEATCQLYQYDGAVAEILWEEADYFYNGARTAAEAAALMQNRVQTYLDEQG